MTARVKGNMKITMYHEYTKSAPFGCGLSTYLPARAPEAPQEEGSK